MISRALSAETFLGLVAKTKPRASAPKCAAANASSLFMIPQIFMRTVIGMTVPFWFQKM